MPETLTFSRVEVGVLLKYIPAKDPDAIRLRERLVGGQLCGSREELETLMLAARVADRLSLYEKIHAAYLAIPGC
jgi:hypothetical protein